MLASPVNLPQAIAVICHPHPQKGGTMHNKVVTTLHKAFHASNMHTIRFSYRGVGKSEGNYDHGQGEVADLVTVLAWVTQNCAALPLYLAGFSFGAYISYCLAARADQKIRQLISIAPPVQYPLFHSLPQPSYPWLVVQGDADEIVDANAVYAWLEKLGNPARVVRFPNTGHFFHGKLVELKTQLIKQLL